MSEVMKYLPKLEELFQSKWNERGVKTRHKARLTNTTALTTTLQIYIFMEQLIYNCCSSVALHTLNLHPLFTLFWINVWLMDELIYQIDIYIYNFKIYISIYKYELQVKTILTYKCIFVNLLWQNKTENIYNKTYW